jgi:hypothetical protein
LIRHVFVPLFIGFLGFASLNNAASSPRFASIRTVDMVQLLASGACFGAAITALLLLRRRPRD